MEDKTPLVSIVIPHWNGIEVLSECIESLKKTDYNNFEIIIVDNFSTDGSQDWIKKNHSDIKLVENKKNHGYAGGCNIGTDYSNGEYIVFLNNDTIQNTNWLSLMVLKIESDNNIAALQPKILNYFKRDLFDYAGGASGHLDVFCYPFARGRLFVTQEIDNGQYDNSINCFWASGTAIMVRKNIFIEANKFEEAFFAHMEEIDLCWKFIAMGYIVSSEPNAKIFHKNATTLPMYSHKKYYLNHRNSLLMLFGNYSFNNMIKFGVIRISFEFVNLFYSFYKLDINHVTGILRALFWILFNPNEVYKKRVNFKKLRKVTDDEIMIYMKKSSSIYDYFIKGKKYYFEIVSKEV